MQQPEIFEQPKAEASLEGKALKPIKLVDRCNKKHGDIMVEVNFAPGKRIPAKEMDETIFLVTWDDGSTGRYQLVDILRLDLDQVVCCLTYPSHGMDMADFYQWFVSMHPGKANGATPMAVYFYRKLV
jgi:hypothetical protein